MPTYYDSDGGSGGGGGGGGVTSHGALTGLGSDDHAQYAQLTGRVGGQTLNGSSDASEHLNLVSTTHATKGQIRVPVNQTVVIGTTSLTSSIAGSDSHAVETTSTRFGFSDLGWLSVAKAGVVGFAAYAGTGAIISGAFSNHGFRFRTNNTDRLELLSNGNMGYLAATGGTGGAAGSYASAVGAFFFKETTTQTTGNPTGGFVVACRNGHLAVTGSTGPQHILTGAVNEIADANAIVTLADYATVHTATLTANRTVTLPASATTPVGFRHRVFSPLAMGGFKVTVSGDINIGSAASFDILTAETGAEFIKASATWRVL